MNAGRARNDQEVQLTFLPEGERVRAPAGSTLLSAAKAAGVDLASLCGGDGLCGKCRLMVKNGNISQPRPRAC